MSLQDMASAAMAVLDAGSCQVGSGAVSGTYRGHPVVLEYRVEYRSGGGGRPHVLGRVHGAAGGVRFHVSQLAVFPDPQYQITGDPAFDGCYDVRGAPMVVLRALFADPELRARMLAVRRTFFDLEPDRLQFGLPAELDAAVLGPLLDLARVIFERLPAAIHRSGALAATGGRSLEFHPEVQAAASRQTTVRFVVFGIFALIVAVPLLGALLLLILAVAC